MRGLGILILAPYRSFAYLMSDYQASEEHHLAIVLPP